MYASRDQDDDCEGENVSEYDLIVHIIVEHYPPTQAIYLFDSLVRPLHQRVVHDEREFGTLAALRDTLLTRLISGELRVKEAERFLRERGL